ncbi:hypothetical protein BAUCODRAFT_288609 [Baudoinia panamericana UAMH 10762]|uniref:Uncharacterized protein n=1 Tax=Baudoinia panamericana (strain UAMH 10762) TaxID=717646 RepID=M2N1B0_BAUPA|nr:uncharacterized protein BAUCODRAFT_288609 [Baudoinia panamericana UAMH 10762]EMC92420.1 hypothetical protein BAUCODRAFT_288609 [Baudoinia panamericana UAMH 10762]
MVVSLNRNLQPHKRLVFACQENRCASAVCAASRHLKSSEDAILHLSVLRIDEYCKGDRPHLGHTSTIDSPEECMGGCAETCSVCLRRRLGNSSSKNQQYCRILHLPTIRIDRRDTPTGLPP